MLDTDWLSGCDHVLSAIYRLRRSNNRSTTVKLVSARKFVRLQLCFEWIIKF